MSFFTLKGGEIIQRSRETAIRFPLAIFSSVLVALISVYFVEVEPKKMEGIYLTLAKIALTGSLAVLVFTTARLLGEQLSKSWHLFWVLVAALGMVLYYSVLPDSAEDYAASIIVFRHIFLSLLFVVALLWAPFFKTNLANEDYWEYAKHILFYFVMAFLFTIVMILGVNGAIFAVEKLFSFDIDGKRYFQADILIVGIFSVGYFLSQIPKEPARSKFLAKPPKVEKFFTKWLLTPLSVLYFVILYTYTAKLLVTQEWPKGILAWLIVAFSIVAILTYLFWTHFADSENKKWRRWIWLAVLLQTVMLFIAIGMRIAEYSWTESRYMVFVLGVWLAGISVYFLLYKNARIKWIFISMSLLIAMSQFGPFSAYNISREAQEARLSEMVKQLKSYSPASKAPIKLRYEISDGIRYLHNRYRGDSLANIFPDIVKAFEKEKTEREKDKKSKNKRYNHNELHYLPEYIADTLGFKLVNRWEYNDAKKGKKASISYTAKSLPIYDGIRGQPLNVKGYDYIVNISKYEYEMLDTDNHLQKVVWSYKKPQISLTYTESFRLIVSLGDNKVVFDLFEMLKGLNDKYGDGSVDVAKDEMILQKDMGHLRVKLELSSLSRREMKGIEVIGFVGTLFVGELK